MILVVGAGGALGSEICRRLRQRGQPVRGLIRPGSPRVPELAALGVEICTGDLRSREVVLEACRGATAVISSATAMGSKDRGLSLRSVDRDGQLQLVQVAAESGVGHFVFVSVAPHLDTRAPLVRYKREVEAAVRGSGMRWTILQPSLFMEIWLSPALGWDYPAGKVRMIGRGDTPANWISLGDVAEYAVRSLEDPRLADREIQLGGPEALSPNGVLRIFEEVSGRRYRVSRVPPAILRLLAPLAARVNEMAASGMRLMAALAEPEPLSLAFQRELALPLKTVREYAAGVAGREK